MREVSLRGRRMDYRVWKTELKITDYQEVVAPVGCKFLTVQVQNRVPCLWFLCDPARPEQIYRIRMVGTGRRIDEPFLRYIATFQYMGGELVFHVFEDFGEVE